MKKFFWKTITWASVLPVFTSLTAHGATATCADTLFNADVSLSFERNGDGEISFSGLFVTSGVTQRIDAPAVNSHEVSSDSAVFWLNDFQRLALVETPSGSGNSVAYLRLRPGQTQIYTNCEVDFEALLNL